MQSKPQIERAFERLLFAARWLMAPMYLGLAVALALLMAVFVREVVHYAPMIVEASSEDAILAVLTLMDLTLAGNLLLIVLFSGYENFVSKLDIDDTVDRPNWMGKVDFSGLKLKLVASIVAISGIHLLKRFMAVGEEPFQPEQLKWMVIIHLTFVVSGVLLAVMDWITSRADH